MIHFLRNGKLSRIRISVVAITVCRGIEVGISTVNTVGLWGEISPMIQIVNSNQDI